MKNYELVIFDLDGTLLDTSSGILPAIRDTLNAFNLAYEEEITAHEFIGPPIEKALQKYLSLEGALLYAAAKEFRERYRNEHLLKATPYAGIEKLLASLRQAGYGRAVASYKREATAERLLWHCGLGRYLNLIHGTTDERPMTKAEIITRCIEDYGLTNRTHAVMVGDTDEDAIGASTAGVDFIAVTYGFGFSDKESLGGFPCVGIADSPEEIFAIIRNGKNEAVKESFTLA